MGALLAAGRSDGYCAVVTRGDGRRTATAYAASVLWPPLDCQFYGQSMQQAAIPRVQQIG